MYIKLIKNDKKRFMELLLLGDEQESMIDKYLDKGDLFALYDNNLTTVCVVLKLENGVYEIKNIATYPKYQSQGYASRMIRYIFEYYDQSCKIMLVGTGNNSETIKFYEKFGFRYSHTVKNFFLDNYDHKIIENGVVLTDMIYLKTEFYALAPLC